MLLVKIFSEFGDKSVRILTSQFKDILQKQCVDTGAIDVEWELLKQLLYTKYAFFNFLSLSDLQLKNKIAWF